MAPLLVVPALPFFGHATHLAECFEHVAVEHLLAIGSVEAFDKAVLHRSARLDVLQEHAILVSPSFQRLADELRTVVEPESGRLAADLDQLIQAFLNIAKNAAEAVAGQADGEIAFSTSFRPGVKVRSAASGAARPQLEVQIIDNGPGLHPDVAERLFEPFASTKLNGMGLGLTVAADIVARHDGSIEVDSAPGRTAFRILLPIDPDDTP